MKLVSALESLEGEAVFCLELFVDQRDAGGGAATDIDGQALVVIADLQLQRPRGDEGGDLGGAEVVRAALDGGG